MSRRSCVTGQLYHYLIETYDSTMTKQFMNDLTESISVLSTTQQRHSSMHLQCSHMRACETSSGGSSAAPVVTKLWRQPAEYMHALVILHPSSCRCLFGAAKTCAVSLIRGWGEDQALNNWLRIINNIWRPYFLMQLFEGIQVDHIPCMTGSNLITLKWLLLSCSIGHSQTCCQAAVRLSQTLTNVLFANKYMAIVVYPYAC